VVLTWVTVAVTMVDLGSLNLWIALGIATIKGSLVVLYFMHLRYDSPFNSIVFVTALIFLFLFLAITIMDTIQYQPGIDQMLEDRVL
jgi:cytochrome c oxidase subunit 4